MGKNWKLGKVLFTVLISIERMPSMNGKIGNSQIKRLMEISEDAKSDARKLQM